MNAILQEFRFDFVSAKNREFIDVFDEEMIRLGYNFGNAIGDGFCWGKYMLIYRKTGVKSKKVYSRIYIRDEDIVLRLFFSNIDKHRTYLELAPEHIKEVFTGTFGSCNHCHNEQEDGTCKFRKTYTIDEKHIEKCNGNTFWFFQPELSKMGDYINLFTEFYPVKQ